MRAQPRPARGSLRLWSPSFTMHQARGIRVVRKQSRGGKPFPEAGGVLRHHPFVDVTSKASFPGSILIDDDMHLPRPLRAVGLEGHFMARFDRGCEYGLKQWNLHGEVASPSRRVQRPDRCESLSEE